MQVESQLPEEIGHCLGLCGRGRETQVRIGKKNLKSPHKLNLKLATPWIAQDSTTNKYLGGRRVQEGPITHAGAEARLDGPGISGSRETLRDINGTHHQTEAEL